MIKLTRILLFFLLTLRAQTSDFSGSLIDIAAFQHYTNSIYDEDLPNQYSNNFLNLSRINLNGYLDISESSRINVSLQGDFIFNKTAYSIFNYISPQTYQIDKTRYDYRDNMNRSGTISIKELYYYHDFNFVKVKLGRQIIDWGYNRFWKGTDLFYPIFEPNYLNHEKQGVDALTFDFQVDSTSKFELIVNINRLFSKFNYVGKYSMISNFLNYSAILGYFESKPIVGFEVSRNVWGIDLRGEGIYSVNTQRRDSNQLNLVIGADYSLSKNVKVSTEYLINGKGQNCKCSYNLIQIKDQNISNLAKYYFSESVNWMITNNSNINATFVQNLNDNSGYVQLKTGYLISDFITLDLAGMLSYGNQFDEFWYYPSSIYFAIKYLF